MKELGTRIPQTPGLSPKGKLKLSLVIPVYNEENNLLPLYQAIHAAGRGKGQPIRIGIPDRGRRAQGAFFGRSHPDRGYDLCHPATGSNEGRHIIEAG